MPKGLAPSERLKQRFVEKLSCGAGERMNEKSNFYELVFKANDIRAIADTELTDTAVARIGAAIGAYFLQHGEEQAIVCQDVRPSSPRVAKGICNALTKAGISVVDIGIYSTPVCYFASHHLEISAAVMVTASHNPAEYNGMKITSNYMTIFGDEIRRIKDIALGNAVASPQTSSRDKKDLTEIQSSSSNCFKEQDALSGSRQNPEAPPATITRYASIEDEYVDYIAERVKLARPLRVGVDAGNGAAGHTAIKLYEALGCEVVPIFCEPDPTFPNHHPDPTIPENLTSLIKAVQEYDLDVGLGFDGDGDRLGVVSDQGEIIWGDMLQILFWRQLLKDRPGLEAPIEVKCSQTLFDEVKRLGGKPFFHKTGHSFIKATMKERGLLFAGEMSGHLFFADEYFGFDDALYAGARLLRLLSEADRRLSAIMDELPKTVATPEIRIDINQSAREELMARIKAHFRATGLEVIEVDGVRVNFPDGWGLLRLSNTQPIMVMRAEASDERALEKIVAEMWGAFHGYT